MAGGGVITSDEAAEILICPSPSIGGRLNLLLSEETGLVRTAGVVVELVTGIYSRERRGRLIYSMFKAERRRQKR